MPRRNFLQTSLLLTLPAITGGFSIPALAADYIPPTRSRGSAVRSVRDYGAIGDGVHNDTAAFQAAINSLPSTGGTVTVPAGKYLIDAVKSVRLRSQMHLKMSSDATLIAKTTSAEKYNVLYVYKVSDVEISGGRIVGDRDRHTGTTGEWGHGIFVRGSKRVTVRDIYISKCWGDGMSIGAALVYNADPIVSDDVAVANIVSTGNRRQGMSIGRGYNIKIYDSEFSNSHGTKPECGIDIEPDDPGISYTVRIENCLIRNNAKYGILAYKRSRGTTIKGCTIERNGSCGLVTVGARDVNVTSNTVRYNSATGIFIQDGTVDCGVSGNTFYGNYTRLGILDRTDFTYSGTSSKTERDILVRGTVSDIRIGTNYYK
jgi:parallel beta-helix repeat protein